MRRATELKGRGNPLMLKTISLIEAPHEERLLFRTERRRKVVGAMRKRVDQSTAPDHQIVSPSLLPSILS
jgi:hypothetical protein